MGIPSVLIDKLKRGRVVLFLGSGALFGAKLKTFDIPTGSGLGNLLSDRFLAGDYKYESLSQISELAISEHGIFDVQEFIKEIFDDIEPAAFHKNIPKFQWKSIFTTNYDRLIETVYDSSKDAKQKLNILLSNNDSLKEGEITNDNLDFVKLHGCITRTRDLTIPLILTVEQYNDYEKNRTSLFNYLYELAIEYSIIFVGHSLQDANIRNIISLVQANVPQGQRHYLLKPKIKDAEINLWSSKKITALDFTFEDFMVNLENSLPKENRFSYLITPAKKHIIQEIFSTHSQPSEELIRFLTNDAEYLRTDLIYNQYIPQDFYKGSDLGWYPLYEDLTIKRSIFDRFIEEVILRPENDRAEKIELVLLKGEAGAGKTVFLKQVAWKIKDIGFGCPIWVRNSERINMEFIREISEKTSERIFLFWDDASINTQKIAHIANLSRKEKIPITIITAERYSEWNLRCEQLKEYISENYILRNLNIEEIDSLITKLEIHDCLGPNLKNKSRQDKVKAFTVGSERQLLVALHEATMGEPFEDIISNEYESIEPIQARTIYRTICTLNRLRVPVRAGLIARIFNISFAEFKDKFFLPLEKIVLWEEGKYEDIHYRARHSEIAEIVFNRSFNNPMEKYNEYIQILSKINISYESDRISFRQLMRAKSLNDIFSDYLDVANIYNHALKMIGEDPYLLQQMANFERIRPNGNLNTAIDLLMNAREAAPYDSSIYHSLATAWRDKAKQSIEPFARMKCRAEARQFLSDSITKWGPNAYASSTMVELAIDNFEDLLIDDSISHKLIDEAISRLEEDIMQAKQRFPDDNIIATHEARLASIMKDDNRVLTSLTSAFNDNNRSPYIAIRLSKIYLEKNNKSEALKILQLAIERTRTNQKLNYHYADILRQSDGFDPLTLCYYYKRSFAPKDQNYQAKFWFARFAYELDDTKEVRSAETIFEELRNVHLSKDEKNKIRDYLGSENTPTLCRGSIKSLHTGFGFISVDGSGKDIFFPKDEIENNLWDALKINDRVKFNIGYSYCGPVCCKITPM